MVADTMKACPNTKMVMAGYSQGGQLVHNAAQLLPAATMAKVSSVVIFGDPRMSFTPPTVCNILTQLQFSEPQSRTSHLQRSRLSATPTTLSASRET